MPGSSRDSQVSLVAVKYGSMRRPVSAATRGQRSTVPVHRGLALIGDSHAAQRGPAGRFHGLAAGAQRGLPDSLGKMLHPAGMREILAEFLVSATCYRAIGGDDQGSDARRAGVNRQDAHGTSVTGRVKRWRENPCE